MLCGLCRVQPRGRLAKRKAAGWTLITTRQQEGVEVTASHNTMDQIARKISVAKFRAGKLCENGHMHHLRLC